VCHGGRKCFKLCPCTLGHCPYSSMFRWVYEREKKKQENSEFFVLTQTNTHIHTIHTYTHRHKILVADIEENGLFYRYIGLFY